MIYYRFIAYNWLKLKILQGNIQKASYSESVVVNINKHINHVSNNNLSFILYELWGGGYAK